MVVHSADHTRIYWRELGVGRTLLCVHGALSRGDDWLPVARLLARRFHVVLMDRRNHGRSQARRPARIEDEAADVAAVIDRVGDGCFLLGHASGGVVALEAARQFGARIDRLVLYEPPVTLVAPEWQASIRHYHDLVSRGRLAAAVRHFALEIEGRPVDQVESLLMPPGVSIDDMVGSITPQLLALDPVELDPHRWTGLRTPVLLLAGGSSAERPTRESIRVLAGLFPSARVVELRGQHHAANLTAPALVANALRDYLATG
ncbi:MAG TPA: alpha/beta hydrolase [Candidatus Dormibacteraeota bacterium]|nr:alpha/beta hydrolase [Candidatus Dormibacteraeota bacterium]